MRQLLKIAYRDLVRNRRRSLLTLVAIAVGVSLLVFMSGFIQGAITDSIENNIRLQTGHLKIRAASYDEDKVSLAWEDLLDNPEELAAQVRGLDGVEAASPVLWASGIVSTREESVGVRVFGIDPLSDVHARIRDGLAAGEYLQPDDRSGVLLGQRLAESLGVAVGDQISLLVNTADEAPDEATFTIRGLYATGVPVYDDTTIFLPLSKAQAFTHTEGRASMILALLRDRELADGLAAALRAPGYTVLTWREMNQVILQAIQAGMGMLYIMYLVVLMVVAVVIANTLLMSVFERIREMGGTGCGPGIPRCLLFVQGGFAHRGHGHHDHGVRGLQRYHVRAVRPGGDDCRGYRGYGHHPVSVAVSGPVCGAAAAGRRLAK